MHVQSTKIKRGKTNSFNPFRTWKKRRKGLLFLSNNRCLYRVPHCTKHIIKGNPHRIVRELMRSKLLYKSKVILMKPKYICSFRTTHIPHVLYDDIRFTSSCRKLNRLKKDIVDDIQLDKL